MIKDTKEQKMVNQEYAMAISETLDILNHTAKEDVDKISTKFMEYLKNNAAKDYQSNLDHSKKISDMQLRKDTKVFLAIIYRKFWCNNEMKNDFDRTLKENGIRHQNELREKYNPDNLFKNKSVDDVTSIEESSNSVAMVEYKELVFTKIKNWIRKLFNK